MDLQNKRIIFYDGYCVFCSGLIQFIIRRDKKELFWYSTIQSKIADDILKSQLKLEDIPDSLIYLRDGNVSFYSVAAIQIFVELGGLYKMISVFYVIPKSLRDRMYKWIAKNRYRMFGRRESCFIPDEKTRARFLDN